MPRVDLERRLAEVRNGRPRGRNRARQDVCLDGQAGWDQSSRQCRSHAPVLAGCQLFFRGGSRGHCVALGVPGCKLQRAGKQVACEERDRSAAAATSYR